MKILVLLLSLCALQCGYTVTTSQENALREIQVVKTPTPELAKGRWQDIYFRFIDERLKETSLSDLRSARTQKGREEYRVWIGFNLSPVRAVILKKDHRVSTASFLPPLEDSSVGLPRVTSLSAPKSGWDVLWRKLDDLRIKTLPDPNDIAKIDGSPSVVIEILNEEGYRNYKYSNVTDRKDADFIAVATICGTLSDEFGVDLLRWVRP